MPNTFLSKGMPCENIVRLVIAADAPQSMGHGSLPGMTGTPKTRGALMRRASIFTLLK
jgi:hypothetical protein